jgi:hypothetical protein
VSFAQKECSCPKGMLDMEEFGGKQANRLFSFSNGKTIGLCGSPDTTENRIEYSTAALFECNTKKIIRDWFGYCTITVEYKPDTIIITNSEWLPVGKDFGFKMIKVSYEKVFYKGNKLIISDYYEQSLPKYSSTQINWILNKYKSVKDIYEYRINDSDIAIAYLLFWAYVSGSYEAETYFKQIEKKYGPFDGAIAEQWDDLWGLYLHYKKHK